MKIILKFLLPNSLKGLKTFSRNWNRWNVGIYKEQKKIIFVMKNNKNLDSHFISIIKRETFFIETSYNSLTTQTKQK